MSAIFGEIGVQFLTLLGRLGMPQMALFKGSVGVSTKGSIVTVQEKTSLKDFRIIWRDH